MASPHRIAPLQAESAQLRQLPLAGVNWQVTGFCWASPVLVLATYNAAKTGYNFYSVDPSTGAAKLVAKRSFGATDDYTG